MPLKGQFHYNSHFKYYLHTTVFSKGPAAECRDFRKEVASSNISAFVGEQEHKKRKAEVSHIEGEGKICNVSVSFVT